MSDNVCGADTADGTPCQHPAGENGRCWIPQHNPDGEGNDDAAPGRPSDFTEDRAHDAIDAAELGMSKSGSARAAGVPVSTLHDWIERGTHTVDGENFSEAFARARARGERRLVEGAMFEERDAPRQMDGQHARFLLSTSFDYVKTEKREVEHAGEDGGPVEFTINREVVDDDGS